MPDYTKINWEDSPSKATPLSADNLNQMDEAIDRLSDESDKNSEKIQSLSDKYDYQEARINVLASLEDGSTTGDAELADIRVDTHGNTHPNAGSSVRSQYTEIKDMVEYLCDGYVIKPILFNVPFEEADNTGWVYSNYIDATDIKKLVVSFPVSNFPSAPLTKKYGCSVEWYNANNTLLKNDVKYLNVGYEDILEFVNSSNGTKFKFSFGIDEEYPIPLNDTTKNYIKTYKFVKTFVFENIFNDEETDEISVPTSTAFNELVQKVDSIITYDATNKRLVLQ